MYITIFVDVVYFTYFLHKILLQSNFALCSNPGPLKEKNLPYFHWSVNSLTAQNLSIIIQLETYNSVYKHDFICISETYFECSVKEGDKKI